MNRFIWKTQNLFFTLKYARILFFDPSKFLVHRTLPILQPIFDEIVGDRTSKQSSSINELMSDGFLWGVPKKRRTAEVRVRRRFGVENFPDTAKILRPRNDLVICERCGDHHEYYAICYTCYKVIKEETDKIRETMRKQSDPMQPKEKEIFFKYETDKFEEKDRSRFQVIDIDRPRPQWFSRYLLSRTITNEGDYDDVRSEEHVENRSKQIEKSSSEKT
ncbi:polycomb group protein Psc-like [Sarcoptes scabiei]|nr:polycomb group protein Psc-like [Sarcoptes scabiei]